MPCPSFVSKFRAATRQILDEDGAASIVKMLVYEILWGVEGDDDRIQAHLHDQAKRDLKVTGQPDVTAAALQSLRCLPKCAILPFLCGPGADKTVCGLISGEQPVAVKALAISVFGPMCLEAWLLADSFQVTTVPVSSHLDLIRKRQDVQDKVAGRHVVSWIFLTV